jgi:hypothetical protein
VSKYQYCLVKRRVASQLPSSAKEVGVVGSIEITVLHIKAKLPNLLGPSSSSSCIYSKLEVITR